MAICVVVIKVVIKYNTISRQMQKQGQNASQHHNEIPIAGWEDTSLMPKNTNQPEHYNKVIRTNRKQFLERRRKNQRQDNIENCELPFPQSRPQNTFYKTNRTLRNDNFSSINQLKRQMANMQKLKDRWEEDCLLSEFNNIQRQRTPNGAHSSLIRSNISGENLDMTRIFVKELQTCRKDKRPLSSVRQGCKRSVTLSHRDNERSQTIHSRCSKRSLSKSGKKQKSTTRKLNITINQIEGKKMKSILQVLKASI